jgi:hypothetical protein
VRPYDLTVFGRYPFRPVDLTNLFRQPPLGVHLGGEALRADETIRPPVPGAPTQPSVPAILNPGRSTHQTPIVPADGAVVRESRHHML